jgi:Raf kinase inhibitor-like YbhB/YbcL family protein
MVRLSSRAGPVIACMMLACSCGLWAFELKSTAFDAGGEIPAVFTCQGRDVSPPLSWSGVPAKTKALVLVCEDPDAPMGTWIHWVYYDIPAGTARLAQGVPRTGRPPAGGVQGRNSFGNQGYGGPCPPWGTHRYFFRLYALDTELRLGEGEKRDAVTAAMKGHVLATAELMGTYSKR